MRTRGGFKTTGLDKFVAGCMDRASMESYS